MAEDFFPRFSQRKYRTTPAYRPDHITKGLQVDLFGIFITVSLEVLGFPVYQFFTRMRVFRPDLQQDLEAEWVGENVCKRRLQDQEQQNFST